MSPLLSAYVAIQSRLHSDERGQTMIEYALILAVVVLVLVAAFDLFNLTGKVGTTVNAVSNKLS